MINLPMIEKYIKKANDELQKHAYKTIDNLASLATKFFDAKLDEELGKVKALTKLKDLFRHNLKTAVENFKKNLKEQVDLNIEAENFHAYGGIIYEQKLA